VSRSLPAGRLIAPLAATLSLAAVLALLVSCAQATAGTRRHACSSSPAAGHKLGARACARSGTGTAHAGPKAKGNRAGHAVARRRSGHASRRGAAVPGLAPSPAAAVCEDSSAPLLAPGEGYFYCDDGSVPSCEEGTTVVPSSEGSSLSCERVAPGLAGSDEAGCEGGGAPVPAGNASPTCTDGSLPSGEGGSGPPGQPPAEA
jgi:hypothetical protein